MLNGLANSDTEPNAGIMNQRRKGKGGISVQDLGYNVIFTGGERTLEKFPEQTIDIQKFEVESDAIFRNRTKKFDGGVLINSLEIDKGLVIQLDSDLAEHCHLILEESIKRLPRKGADPNEMRMEIMRNK
jgi:hypothetical protein